METHLKIMKQKGKKVQHQREQIYSRKNSILSEDMDNEGRLASLPDPRSITFSSIIILNRLGRGSTSHVFKTQLIKTRHHFAMKVIHKSMHNQSIYNNNLAQGKKDDRSKYTQIENGQKEAIARQLSVWTKVNHRNIVKYYTHFEDNQNTYILTQYCKNGEITKFLLPHHDDQSRKQLAQPKLIQIMRQLCEAIYHLHVQLQYAHGDIKLSNILLDQNDNVKLCDFGFSVPLSHHSKQVQCDVNASWSCINNDKNGPYGTLLYMSPEILVNKCNKYHKQADIWALGICILTLIAKGNPYSSSSSSSSLYNKIVNSQYMKPNKANFPCYSQKLLSLVWSMLEPDFKKRPDIQKIISNPIFQQFNPTDKITGGKNCQVNMQECQDGQSDQNQKQQIDRSLTTDTSTQHEQPAKIVTNRSSNDCNTKLQIYKIYPYSLCPRRYESGDRHGQQQAYIQILPNYEIVVKVAKFLFKIEVQDQEIVLTVLEGMKQNKSHRLDAEQLRTMKESSLGSKIIYLYNYALQLIQILKKKQCLHEELIDGRYFWARKGYNGANKQNFVVVGALFQNTSNYRMIMEKTKETSRILARNLQQNEINVINIENATQNSLGQISQQISALLKGELKVLQKLQQCFHQ